MLQRKDQQILKLKAAMWESGNEKLLLSKAIRAYQDPSARDQPKDTVEIYLNGHMVIVKNVPHIFKGNELYENVRLSAALEEVLEERYDGHFPTEINFEELLK
jgi:hypothetical protein